MIDSSDACVREIRRLHPQDRRPSRVEHGEKEEQVDEEGEGVQLGRVGRGRAEEEGGEGDSAGLASGRRCWDHVTVFGDLELRVGVGGRGSGDGGIARCARGRGELRRRGAVLQGRGGGGAEVKDVGERGNGEEDRNEDGSVGTGLSELRSLEGGASYP